MILVFLLAIAALFLLPHWASEQRKRDLTISMTPFRWYRPTLEVFSTSVAIRLGPMHFVAIERPDSPYVTTRKFKL